MAWGGFMTPPPENEARTLLFAGPFDPITPERLSVLSAAMGARAAARALIFPDLSTCARCLTPVSDRIRAIAAAIRDLPGVEVADFDLLRLYHSFGIRAAAAAVRLRDGGAVIHLEVPSCPSPTDIAR
jgi:nicotinic acid mononucleotide adenylyltransferase